MITRDTAAFLDVASCRAPEFDAAIARAAFLVSPEKFRRAEDSARDNRYMSAMEAFDAGRATDQHRALQRALADCLPTLAFPGHAQTPDGIFPNNVFATARPAAGPRAIVGRMRHAIRQEEAKRPDIHAFFSTVLEYPIIDLSTQAHPCELTGALVIDRARGIGFAGLSERCDETGAQLMHEAFGLRATLLFDLAPGEYHTNVVLAVLAGRAALLCPRGFADDEVAAAIVSLYASHAIVLSEAEHAAFAANAIALSHDIVWMSAGASASLRPSTRAALAGAGFTVRDVALDAIEAAGGSLRCCIAEIF